MTTTDWIQAISMVVLVIITGIYAWGTYVISKATKEQADASMKMAEEMKEQRVMASRPVIIQKAMSKSTTSGSLPYFIYFEICNAGNGPAIELETSLLDKDKKLRESHRDSFLKSGDPTRFDPSILVSADEGSFYLVSEYQGILSRGISQTWYQTWLPFKATKASEADKIYVIAGELEFREISEKERIDAFTRRSKPK